jgi:hypothetical protein
VRANLAALGFFDLEDSEIDSEQVLAYVSAFHGRHAEDRPFTITRSYVSKLISNAEPGSRNWELERRLSMPPEALFARRLETLTLGVLGQLETTANWHRIMGELLDGGEPSTEHGRQEAAFFGSAVMGSSAA